MGWFDGGLSNQIKRLRRELGDQRAQFGIGKTGQPPQQPVGQPGADVSGRLRLPQKQEEGRPFSNPHAEMLDLAGLLKGIQGQMGAPFQPDAKPGEGPEEEGMPEAFAMLKKLSQNEEPNVIDMLGALGLGQQQGSAGFGGFGGQGEGNVLQNFRGIL